MWAAMYVDLPEPGSPAATIRVFPMANALHTFAAAGVSEFHSTRSSKVVRCLR